MAQPDHLGSSQPRLVLYLPHRPDHAEQLALCPSAQALIAANSNHWRKIITLLAKVACPVADDWRGFRDNELFLRTALNFSDQLRPGDHWHWIGGKDNLQRFTTLEHRAQPLATAPAVAIDPDQRLLLTPYPDYRQLSNHTVAVIREALAGIGFYEGNTP
ncbi:DUF6942 family protein [Marinobacter zhejiangensis]|uniref:Uncharacterized protein n=1 Tax=Marinobacter zhejiangensis TaxID=488535 RepID=A0A1I4Q0R3_9GAMM|nr:hypothetical protein [Marinobacter zhejiangensis]SFM33662.1 hypothetical protein SAMN04487963_2116 [Marinobacter zhejiangensis]